MIYNKDAVFPYPVLSRTVHSYQENYFTFDVNVTNEDEVSYEFTLEYNISSPFLIKLLEEEKATLMLIVQSGDNYFERLSYGQTVVNLKKNRLSLSKRTKLQLHIQSLEIIGFEEANDLSSFFNEYKAQIEVKRHSLLAYSDEVVFESSEVKPVDLFEQSIQENMKMPFKIDLTSETIVLVFKDRELSLKDASVKKSLRNMYFYLGLNRALTEFIESYIEDEEFIALDSIDPDKGLHRKLKELMISKGIMELNPGDIDETIQKMSDKIVEKYVTGIKEIVENGN
ncbi:hypothetical protein ACODG4_00450 [Vagococcus fluvialis]|uniref:hypothetical protein n=1 Tax=Vagococcus fluvialis TaxID=2738 RepID=UPI001D0AC39F|nr:hypothetical protein [Vagococcus fluvialis]UDM74388.1 hypothetical protein K5K99_01795 [Vagococcus fluvialis]